MGCHTWFSVPLTNDKNEILIKAQENLNKNDWMDSSTKQMYQYAIDNELDSPCCILYDLNRNESVILTFITDPKWINDYAASQVIRSLKKRIDELEHSIFALENINKLINL